MEKISVTVYIGWIQNTVYLLLSFFPDEYGDHNHCRQIFLNNYERDPQLNNASSHHYVQLPNSWQLGPWCYVNV